MNSTFISSFLAAAHASMNEREVNLRNIDARENIGILIYCYKKIVSSRTLFPNNYINSK